VSVQALESDGSGSGAANPEVELGTELTLRGVRLLEACRQSRIVCRGTRPALDATGRF
jgi:hypothetical protein